jgi:hypothetical protein
MTDTNLPGNQNPQDTGLDENQLNQEVELSEEEKLNPGEKTSKKISSLIAIKQYWREKALKAIQDAETFKKELDTLKNSTPTPPTNPPVNDATAVEVAARKVAMDMRKEEFLTEVPEDKREVVKDFYNSLTAGKEVTIQNFSGYMSAAMRAAGVEQRQFSSHKISTHASGSIPPTQKPGPTKEEVDMARKAGNDPEKVYGEKVDFSNLLNADKFIDKKEEF